MKLVTLTFTALFIGLACAPVHAQGWPVYGGDEGGSKYSSLTEINRENVRDLELAWSYRTGDAQRPPADLRSAGFPVTPILLPEEAGGALVLCSTFNKIIALDPVTGVERWRFDPEIEVRPFGAQYKCRGVAQWQDRQADPQAACSWRLFMTTVDRRLISVDARTGKPCGDFGTNGQVDVAPLIDATGPSNQTSGVSLSSPPAIVSDTVIIGSTVGPKFRRVDAPSGAVRAFDARTGAPKWSFDPVPRNPDDPQAVTWTPEALAITGGGNVWSIMSVDYERDLVFLPTSSASPNFYGGTRPGDNRYSNSVVALRGSTGELIWHYQILHHGVWDYDLPTQPMLVDLTRNGETVPVVVQLTKQGFVFVLHRETGEPIFEVEEREVATDGPTGESLSPTQPFPTAPPPLMPQGITPEDAWGFTLYDREACRNLISSYRYGDIYTPVTTQGTIMYPGASGGSNWGGGAFEPAANILVANISRFPYFIRLVPMTEMDPDAARAPLAGIPGGPPGPIAGTPFAIERKQLLSPFGAPCTEPPWFTLVAVDLEQGRIKWTVPLGTIEKVAPFPIPLEFGAPGMGGPIITAGGLIFIGSTADEKFRAFDIETGEELWKVKLPTAAMATPMTYEVQGRQYVVIAAGGHQAYYPQNKSDHVLAFTLPPQDR